MRPVTLERARRAKLALVTCVVVACAGASPQPSVPPRGEQAPLPTAKTSVPALPDCTSCLQDGEQAATEGDPARAVGLFERGCQQGEAAACNAAARIHAIGAGVPEDDPRAIALFVRACELGHWPACGIGGPMIESQSRAAEGRVLLARGCEGGHAQSCNNLAVAYERGLGGAVDLPASSRAFGRSCELGNAVACAQYGIAFQTGRGVVADAARARALYERSCDGGELVGCGNLGVSLRDGSGGPVDMERAVLMFDRACAGGRAGACVNLGVAFLRGAGGLTADPERAVELFEIGCKGGVRVGCDNVEKVAQARETQAAPPQPQWTTSIGSLTIGSGDQTATFEEVRSTCSALPLGLAFGAAAGAVRACLDADAVRRVSLAVDGGRVVSSRVEPDDVAGRCVATALGRAPLGSLTCVFEANVSR